MTTSAAIGAIMAKSAASRAAQTTKNPAINFAIPSAKRRKKPLKANEATKLRDALPFFRKRTRKVEASWWNVTPTGNYSADLETGARYAREFFPLLMFNAGASDLGAIVSAMAKAGRDPKENPKDYRHIDAVALGFMMEIAGALQSAIGALSMAAVAIEEPSSDLGAKLLPAIKSGEVFRSMKRSTLFHDPNASIFELPAQ